MAKVAIFSARIGSDEDTAMTYAPHDRAIYDADSHIMELPDFLQKYADPAVRDEIPAVSYSASIVTDEEVAEIMARGGKHSDEHLAELLGLGDKLIEKSKEIQALGAFDGKERKTAMDMLGFRRQLAWTVGMMTVGAVATAYDIRYWLWLRKASVTRRHRSPR